MRKISQMYQWSGGTDYRNTCYKCDNCIKVKRGSSQVYKCRTYGATEDRETDWNPANIACKYFNKPPQETLVMKMCECKKSRQTDAIEGQMNISDFLSG